MSFELPCTEEEPDDNFVPGQAPAEATAATAQDNALGSEEQEPEPLGPPMLRGAWHQLEGVPRPAASGSRLLAWNLNGHVSRFPDQRRLEVQYAEGADAEDGAAPKPQRLADQQYQDVEMASLCGSAACFAVGSGSDGGSRLYIRPKDRWDKAAFTAAMGSGDETVEAVTSGDGFVAALTSRRLLRVYSLAGIPLGLTSMSGRSVALAARGPLLLVVTGGSTPPEDGQDEALHFRLIDVKTSSQRAAGRLPLSAGSRLRWLGLSAEFIPVAIDTTGCVRALIGSGPGSWGSALGLGTAADWTPVLDLAPEEERSGPLWVVHVARGMLFCAEVGQSLEEPRPRPLEPGSLEAGAAAATESLAPPLETEPTAGYFGHGSALREVPWRLPIGPLTTATAAAEEALREQILARHLEEITSTGLPVPHEWNAAVGGPSKTFRSKAFFLFGQLVKADEVERALDVARTYLMGGAGGSKGLMMGKTLAEKCGQLKLADEIVKLSQSASVLPSDLRPVATPQATAAARGTRRSLPPLFQPGETDAVDEGEAKTEQAVKTEQVVKTEPPATLPPVKTEPVVPTKPVSAAPAAAAPVQSSNPFARKRPAASPVTGGSLLAATLGGPASKMMRTA